jgi:catechol 2,3-dioxygenase-like lactoylglutathione lyase family enzyme
MLAFADVAVTVSDAQDAAQWWYEKLGFATHTIGPPGSHAVVVAPPGDRFLLHLCEKFEPVDPGNTGIAFVTDDLAADVARLEKGGVEIVERAEDGGATVKFADPDGNVYWLIGVPTEFIRAQVGRRAPEKPLRSAQKSKSARRRKGAGPGKGFSRV